MEEGLKSLLLTFIDENWSSFVAFCEERDENPDIIFEEIDSLEDE